jgi:hypothetical protein
MPLYTPKGFQVVQAFPGLPHIGAQVRICSRSAHVLDWPYIDRTGELLGYTLPHGFAVVASSSEELLVHPESLECI